MNRNTLAEALIHVDGIETLPTEQGLWLYDHAMVLNRGDAVLEVGSYRGRSALCLCAAAEERGFEVYAITTFWEDRDRVRLYNTVGKYIEDGRLHVTEQDSAIAMTMKVREGFRASMVWIDGDHSFHQASLDVVNALFIAKDGALIAVHDYARPTFDGVVNAVDLVLKPTLANIGKFGPIWYGTKPAKQP